jgi:hypothetical protein
METIMYEDQIEFEEFETEELDEETEALLESLTGS